MDLAWIGDGANYHTPRDSLPQLVRGSLQHTGDAVLALLQPFLRIAASVGPPAEAMHLSDDAAVGRAAAAAAAAGRVAAAAGGAAGAAGGEAPAVVAKQALPETPFFNDLLGWTLLLIPAGAFWPLTALATVLLLLDYRLQQHPKVLRLKASSALICLSCLTFGLSCLSAAAAASCCCLLGALLPQLQGQLYTNWPLAAFCRVIVAFAALVWTWDKTFFRRCVFCACISLLLVNCFLPYCCCCY